MSKENTHSDNYMFKIVLALRVLFNHFQKIKSNINNVHAAEKCLILLLLNNYMIIPFAQIW
jgi:hypothetical protein